jgi:hypothetical protein
MLHRYWRFVIGEIDRNAIVQIDDVEVGKLLWWGQAQHVCQKGR